MTGAPPGGSSMSEWTMFSEPSSHSTVNLVGMYCGEREIKTMMKRDEEIIFTLSSCNIKLAVGKS